MSLNLRSRSLRRRTLGFAAPVVVAGLLAASVLAASPAQAALAQPAGVRGFDISQDTPGAQSPADFQQAASAGAQFVYIKASGGVKVTNDNFAAQLSGAEQAHLLVGTYHLAAPNTGSGTQQADWFADHDGQWHPDGDWLPPMLDLEKNNQQTSVNACYDMSASALVSWIKTYAAEVEVRTGRTPVLYAGKDFTDECLGNTPLLASYQVFVPNYSQSPASVTGGLAASWANFSFWQYSDQPTTDIPGDQDVFNGSLTSLRLLNDPTWGGGSVVSSADHDYTGDHHADVHARLGDQLRLYRGTGRGGFSSYANVLSDVKKLTAIVAPGDLNGDGIPDLLGRWPSGALYLYAGKPGGAFRYPVAAATGMNTMNLITSVGDFNGDGKADLLTRDTKGILWLYEGNGKGQFSGRVQIGSNFSPYKQIVGVDDFGPGHAKGIVTEDGSGTVRFQPRTSTGFGSSNVIGTGWNAYNTLTSPGDLTGDGVSDLLVRRASGEMSVYPGTGSGKLKPRVIVATGWKVFSWIG